MLEEALMGLMRGPVTGMPSAECRAVSLLAVSVVCACRLQYMNYSQ